MNILIAAAFSETTKAKIRECFPEDVNLTLTDSEHAEPFLAEADAIIPEHLRIDRALLDKAPRLRFIQTGAGYDNIDLAACRERRITVCSAAGVNANAVAEHTLALILAWCKNITYLDRNMKGGTDPAELRYTGAELCGMTAGIIGPGAVGQRTAGLCRAFGMKVLGYSRTPKTIEGIQPVSFETLLRESDIVSLHVPLTEDTRRMIDRRALETMKSTALLINTSRGDVVDEEALIEALEKGEIAGACLDVFAEEPLPAGSRLRTLPNVILTPHTAGFPDGEHFHKARYEFFARNIRTFFSGERPLNILNDI